MDTTYTGMAVRMLRRKRFLQAAAETLREQVRFLEGECDACRSSADLLSAGRSYDALGAKEQLLDLLCRLEDSRRRLRVLEEELEQIRRAYALLSPYQQDLLDTFFASGEKNCAEVLAERYYRERSAVYRDRKKALEQFTLAVFGVFPEDDAGPY